MNKIEFLKRKINFIKERNKYYFTTVLDLDDFEVLKNGWNRAIKKYNEDKVMNVLDDTDFWNNYMGLTKTQSNIINEILIGAIISGKWINKKWLVNEIMKNVNIDRYRAETILMTELANFANRVRIEMYKTETRVKLVRIENENDGRVCKLCKEIARKTRRGIPINELEGKLREWTNGLSRGYVIHSRCRCIVVRVDKRNKKWWE